MSGRKNVAIGLGIALLAGVAGFTAAKMLSGPDHSASTRQNSGAAAGGAVAALAAAVVAAKRRRKQKQEDRNG